MKIRSILSMKVKLQFINKKTIKLLITFIHDAMIKKANKKATVAEYFLAASIVLLKCILLRILVFELPSCLGGVCLYRAQVHLIQ